MRGQPGFFDIDDRLKRLSDLGDQLETFRSAVDFELFRPELMRCCRHSGRGPGRPCDHPTHIGVPESQRGLMEPEPRAQLATVCNKNR
jgi:hypothetical protein